VEFFDTVFAGGGLSCLSAASGLRGDFLLCEREERVGGLCRTDRSEGFAFDRTGHLLHLQNPAVRSRVERLLARNLRQLRRDAWIFSHGVFTRYPFQENFFGLPPEVAAECLLGLFAAQRKAHRSRGRGDGRVDFARWAVRQFGPGVARHFLLPYNRKLWCVSPSSLTTEWLGRFVPRPDLRAAVLGTVSDRRSPAGYNASFFYPRRGGIEALVRALARAIPPRRIRAGLGVEAIDLRHRRLRLSDGSEIGFGRLVSCLPLSELARRTAGLPPALAREAARLRCASVYNLNLGIRGQPPHRRHWVYLPEDRFALYRFGYSSHFAADAAPPGCSNVYTELAYRGRPPDPAALRRRVLSDLRAIGVIRSERDVLAEKAFDIPFAYCIHDRHRKRAVRRLLRYFESREVYSIGRYGRWEYSSMEDAILQGLELARLLSGRRS
jgi:protoporphyrinogen oxidase